MNAIQKITLNCLSRGKNVGANHLFVGIPAYWCLLVNWTLLSLWNWNIPHAFPHSFSIQSSICKGFPLLRLIKTLYFWLVVEPTPLKNDGVRQLGGWHSQLNGKLKNVPNHQPVLPMARVDPKVSSLFQGMLKFSSRLLWNLGSDGDSWWAAWASRFCHAGAGYGLLRQLTNWYFDVP
jgi:hypothetical protein